MNKYRNRYTYQDNIRFDSIREASRYQQLKLLQLAGEIHDLELQPKYDIVINGTKVCKYIGDFRYVDSSGKTILEDCKGFRTAMYRLKKKLLQATYGIVIEEV